MRMITLWQPWASLIATQHKIYETRSWSTSYRGILGIHSAKKWTKHLVRYTEYLSLQFPDQLSYYAVNKLPLGCVVAAVKLVDVIETEKIRDLITPLERAVGDWSDGRYAWRLEFIKTPDQPIPAKGMQGFWDWSPDDNK